MKISDCEQFQAGLEPTLGMVAPIQVVLRTLLAAADHTVHAQAVAVRAINRRAQLRPRRANGHRYALRAKGRGE